MDIWECTQLYDRMIFLAGPTPPRRPPRAARPPWTLKRVRPTPRGGRTGRRGERDPRRNHRRLPTGSEVARICRRTRFREGRKIQDDSGRQPQHDGCRRRGRWCLSGGRRGRGGRRHGLRGGLRQYERVPPRVKEEWRENSVQFRRSPFPLHRRSQV